MRALGIILGISIIAFIAWFIMRPDPRSGEDAVEDQFTEAAEDAADEAAPTDSVAEEMAAEPSSASTEEEMAAAEEEEEPIPEAMGFTAHGDEIVALFENAPWVSAGRGGPPLYVISFRTCPTCLAFKAGEQDALIEAGVDIRWIIYARRDREGRERSSTEERAVQAELWLTRDWHLFQDWFYTDPDTYYVTEQLPPVAEEDPVRSAAVEEARALVDTLADLYAAEGIDLAIPTLLWQQDGEWMTYVGYDEDSFAPVRDYFTSQ